MRKLALLVVLAGVSFALHAADWPRFRGPGGAGISDAKNTPLKWDAQTNIRWKTELPGPGASSPILFGQHIYLTCYTGYGIPKTEGLKNESLLRHFICLNRADGKILWDKTMPPKVTEWYGGFTSTHGFASSTPAADADGVYVYYGASGLRAYSHDGELKWEKDCGTQQHDGWGSATSPLLYKDLVIVHADVESETIYAFERKTGREVWSRKYKNTEQHFQHTRATPLILPRAGGDELIIHSRMTWLESLNPTNGETRWEFKGTTSYQHSSVVTDGNRVFALTHQKATALDPGGKLAWQFNKGSEMCTPVFYGGHLYWSDEKDGYAYCVDAATGTKVYAERMDPHPKLIYSSGVLAEGRIYYVSREMGTFVVAAKPKYELLAHNTLGDESIFNATPAVEDGRIYLRSDKCLYCIGTK